MREPGGPLTRNESDRWVVTKALWGLIERNVPLVAVRIARTSIPDSQRNPKAGACGKRSPARSVRLPPQDRNQCAIGQRWF